MTEPPNKKSKKENEKSRGYQYRSVKRHFLEVGHKGFLATCNFREKDCVRECYNILSQYADELYGPEPKSNAKAEDRPAEEESTENDISDDLQREIDATKAAAEPGRSRRFQAVDTGAKNCVFIKTTLQDPVELGTTIIKDVAEKKVRKTRYLLRLTPIDTVCKANMDDITRAGGAMFDKYFLEGARTFGIVFNKRYNNDIRREEIIKVLADLVIEKNVRNKVDLKNPDLSVVVEVIKGKCCMSVVEGYFKYRKYNLVELAAGKAEPKEESKDEKTDESSDKVEVDSDEVKRDTTDEEPVSEEKPKEEPPTVSKLKELLEGKKVEEQPPTVSKLKELLEGKKPVEAPPVCNKLKELLEGKKPNKEEPTAKNFKEEPDKSDQQKGDAPKNKD